jgi:hypothetical protein
MALLPPTTLAVRDGSFLGSVFYEIFKVQQGGHSMLQLEWSPHSVGSEKDIFGHFFKNFFLFIENVQIGEAKMKLIKG